jgi:lysophospholipase L1-like esterase
MRSDIVVFGDSVTWGQGHKDANKFANQVADALHLKLDQVAHSGATIGRNDVHTASCGPEAPIHYPTIFQQVARAGGNPDDAAVVIVDGGINDIGVQVILNPFTLKAFLRNQIRRYCFEDMVALLTTILTRYPASETTIVVTGYFPVFSNDSDFNRVLDYLHGIGIAPPPHLMTSDKDRRAFAFASIELALLFWQESRLQLQRAVAAMQTGRVIFADVPFQEENAMFASHPWLFNVHLDAHTGRLVPEDDVIAERHEQCVKCYPHDPFGRAFCDIASAGHPNRPGSEQYTTAILAALGR